MAVIDSSVLIHLSRIGKLDLLKKFFGKIEITNDVYKEIKKGRIGVSEIEEGINNWIFISDPNSQDIDRMSKIEGIERADTSIIILAKEKNKILLSNDYALIVVGRSKNIECWWLTTLIIQCLKKSILSKRQAKKILLELIESGMNLNNKVYSLILKKIEEM